MSATVKTELTLMQLYPHAKKPRHFMMGLLTLIFIIPAGYIAFILLLGLKIAFYAPLYLGLMLPMNRASAGRIWELKNRALLPVHHIIYKCKGGTNSLENCVLLCRNCHRELHKNNPTRVVRKPRKHRRK